MPEATERLTVVVNGPTLAFHETITSIEGDRSHMAKTMLTDGQLRDFIRNGYTLVQPELPPEFHQEMFSRVDSVFETEGNPGNNLIARIPAIQEVFDDPVVDGTLTGVLGPNYYMHPHRHCHYRPPGGEGQTLHKDGFSRRRHRTRWILAMYYPQETTVDMGPTGVVPGSQYYNTEVGSTMADEVPVPVPAGSVAIVNYDIWHRGMANTSDKKRYMIKLLFLRMEEPVAPSWDSRSPDWGRSNDGHDVLESGLWAWHQGTDGKAGTNGHKGSESVLDLVNTLATGPEPECIKTAYRLGEVGADAVPALIDSLTADHGPVEPIEEVSYGRLPKANRSEAVRRNISYALTQVGGPAVEALTDAVGHEDWWVRDAAVETLGDIGLAAKDATSALGHALTDESLQVRRHAAEAIGIAGPSSADGVPALIDALQSQDDELRRNSALALAKTGEHASEAVPMLKGTLRDRDRYVRGQAVEALRRIGTPEARQVLIDDLMTSRWCEITTSDSLF